MIYHAAGQAIRDGKIGKVVMGQGSYTRNSQNGEWNYGIDGGMTPETLDWDLWLGSAPARPWDASAKGAGDGEGRERMDSKARYHRYRKFSDYSAGILGDLMPHKLHPFLIASGNPEYPVRVSAVGTQLGKDREVADTVQVLAEFPSGWSMLFVGSTVNEQGMQDMFRGNKATIYFGNAVELKPERWASEEIEAATIPVVGPTWESHENHEMNWLDAIRGKKVDGKVVKANCNIDLATKVQTIVSLAEMSIRLNKTMLFDAKTRKVTAG
jgi:predicted dehydrogenase